VGRDERIRVVRVIEYVGPKDWIETTMTLNAVSSDGPKFTLAGDRWVREIARGEQKA
jgi:hypothetical protein